MAVNPDRHAGLSVLRNSELGGPASRSLLIIVGLPIAVVIAWAFELTPQGIKRTEVADALPAASARKKHAWIYVTVAGALLSIGIFFVGRYTAATRQGSTADVSAKSIAVLPFENLNHDPDTDYLCDGIPESINNSLSELPTLKVMSRSSVFHYKGKETDAQTVGRELKVQTGTSQAGSDNMPMLCQSA